jgi:hypothetical protein
VRRLPARGNLLAGHTRGQQSEYGLLSRHKHRHDSPHRGALEADRLRHALRKRFRMARTDQQVSSLRVIGIAERRAAT